MKRSDAKINFQSNIILSNKDFKILESNFDRRRLYEWQQKGHILQVKKGYYILNKEVLGDAELFMIANKIYPPSYISLESALSYYNLIPEGVFKITSITTKTTRNYDSAIGSFDFYHIQNKLFVGYTSKKYDNYKYNIATVEKAIFDFLYLKPQYGDIEDFEGLRIDTDILYDLDRDAQKLIDFGVLSGNKKCQKRIQNFISYVKQNA